jgi:hypothetical protein
MDQNTQQQPAAVPQQPVKTEKQHDEEFSLAWHLKVLAVIYVVLGIFYVILKIALK